MRSFRYGEHLIYGVTARVLANFLEMIEPHVAADAEAPAS